MVSGKENKNLYHAYLNELTYSGLKFKLPIVFLLVGYYMFSDLYIRNNIQAFYTRLIPIVPAIILSILLFSQKYKSLKVVLYNFVLAGLPIMMYGKCIVHLDNLLASSVSGTILVLFMISLDLKTNIRISAVIYFVPFLLFLLLLFFIFDPDRNQFLNISNIFPIVIFGFIANRIQYKLRFNDFDKNRKLIQEKERSEQLYNQTMKQNQLLIEQRNTLGEQAEVLDQNQKRLKIMVDAKDKFVSIISHDLRNPLSAIISFSELIQNENITIDERNEYLEIINTSAKHTINIFDNLLQWSIYQNENRKLNKSETDINEIIQNVLKLYKPTLITKGLTCEFKNKQSFIASVDKEAIETVIRNLLSNAIKYSTKGSLIEIQSFIEVYEVVIKIKDSGIGIKETDFNKLFIFEDSLQKPGTNKEKGTGLGLFLCKEFVEQHNGSINVESRLGEGTTFTVRIPIK